MINGTEQRKAEAWIRVISRMFWRCTLYSAIIVASVYVLFRLKLVLVYLFVAAIIAYVMRPMAGWVAHRKLVLTRRKPLHVRRVEATLWVLILIFVGGGYGARLLATPFVSEVQKVFKHWDEYKGKFDKYSSDFTDWYSMHVKPEWREKIEAAVKKNSATETIQNRITEWIGTIARHTGEVLHNVVEIVLLPVLAFYFALDSKKLKHELVGTLPRPWRREWLRMTHAFNQIMYSFVAGQAILCTLAGVFVGLVLLCLRVPYATTLGVLAGLTRAIPIIGPIIGGIPIILLTLVTNGLGTALFVLAVFTFMHFAESKFIMPMLIGDRMELHPVVIIVVLLIGQEFGGLLGMFFAAPIAAIIRVIVRRYWLKAHRKVYVKPLRTPAIPESVD